MHLARSRQASLATAVSVLLGAGAGLAGMLLYPGGTWFDPRATGYDFWLNFLCDSMHRVALNGVPNEFGALCTQASLVILMLGLVPLWLAIPSLFKERRSLAKIIRWGGVIATLAMLTIPLTPSDRFGALHGVAVSIAGPLGIAAIVSILVGLCSVWRAQRMLTIATVALIALCLIDLVLYLRVSWLKVELTPILPIVQKIAYFVALFWMLLAARAVRESARTTAQTR